MTLRAAAIFTVMVAAREKKKVEISDKKRGITAAETRKFSSEICCRKFIITKVQI